jgi:hypothetical protein
MSMELSNDAVEKPHSARPKHPTHVLNRGGVGALSPLDGLMG